MTSWCSVPPERPAAGSRHSWPSAASPSDARRGIRRHRIRSASTGRTGTPTRRRSRASRRCTSLRPLRKSIRPQLVEPFLQDALDQGVRRVVQLSSSALPEGAPGLGEVHRLVRSTMPEWTVLRPSWFMQNFTGDHLVAQGVRDGEIVTATGDGRVAFIDADDIAAVAGRALTDAIAHNTDHVLTGPPALSYAEAADDRRPAPRPPGSASAGAGRRLRLSHRRQWDPTGVRTDTRCARCRYRRRRRRPRHPHRRDLTGRPARTFEEFCAPTSSDVRDRCNRGPTVRRVRECLLCSVQRSAMSARRPRRCGCRPSRRPR